MCGTAQRLIKAGGGTLVTLGGGLRPSSRTVLQEVVPSCNTDTKGWPQKRLLCKRKPSDPIIRTYYLNPAESEVLPFSLPVKHVSCRPVWLDVEGWISVARLCKYITFDTFEGSSHHNKYESLLFRCRTASPFGGFRPRSA